MEGGSGIGRHTLPADDLTGTQLGHYFIIIIILICSRTKRGSSEKVGSQLPA